MIVIEPYRPTWPTTFNYIGATIRSAVGDQALATHHIGSTSMPGLAAENIIDVQLSDAVSLFKEYAPLV